MRGLACLCGFGEGKRGVRQDGQDDGWAWTDTDGVLAAVAIADSRMANSRWGEVGVGRHEWSRAAGCVDCWAVGRAGVWAGYGCGGFGWGSPGRLGRV